MAQHGQPFACVERGVDSDAHDPDAAGDKAGVANEGPETVAALILEPVQNSGGSIVPPEGYFDRVREICDANGLLLVADEVICGFGRVGDWFGSTRYGIEPDMMDVSAVPENTALPEVMLEDVVIAVAPQSRRAEFGPTKLFVGGFGQTTTVASSTRHMQTPGSTTAGGETASPSGAFGAFGPPVRTRFTISSAIAVQLHPSSTIAVESSATPPSWTNGNNGPRACP